MDETLIVFINPGHDQLLDPGAVCPDDKNFKECDIAWEVGILLKKYLTEAGVQVADCVQDDDLQYICACANRSAADLFISIHCDSTDNRQANGTTSYVWELGNQASRFAECVQEQICGAIKTLDRGVRVHPKKLYVLKNTLMPAVLIELAFISNEWDATQLRYRQDDFARAIARAVTDYERLK